MNKDTILSLSKYFWIKNQIVVLSNLKWYSPGFQRSPYINYYCVDLDHANPKYRYGMYQPEVIQRTDWLPVPFEDFPAEFKLQLLLIGVS